MIALVRGIIRSMSPGMAIVDVNGLGCRVLLCPGEHERLPPVGETATLHTHLHVQEDALTLYGFCKQDQLTFFELLLKVSGIGPRVALGVVGSITAQEFYTHIMGADVAALVRLPGIGRKTAQRILLDLRDKVPDMPIPATTVEVMRSDLVEPGCEALMALGYTYAEARGAIQEVLQGKSSGQREIQDVVEEALRHLVRM